MSCRVAVPMSPRKLRTHALLRWMEGIADPKGHVGLSENTGYPQTFITICHNCPFPNVAIWGPLGRTKYTDRPCFQTQDSTKQACACKKIIYITWFKILKPKSKLMNTHDTCIYIYLYNNYYSSYYYSIAYLSQLHIYLFVCLFVYLSIHLSIHPSINLI